MNRFSYDEYRKIIREVKKTNRAKSFSEAYGKDDFIIMRHDVEFSMERAYHLALLEHEEDFQSVYFVQLTNNAYNILSQKNIDLLHLMSEMGHKIGLHFHLHGLTDIEAIREQIIIELEVLERMLKIPICGFSIHRPTADILEKNIHIDGYWNAYQDDFFEFVRDMSVASPTIKYLSDARHQWNYNLYPDGKTFEKYKKIQILTHPYSWTEIGYDNLNNFNSLIKERNRELISTIDEECKHFSLVKGKLIGDDNERKII